MIKFNKRYRLFWALIFFLAINIVFFSSGFYAKFLTFSSMQGFAHHIVNSAQKISTDSERDILIIGDSRVTEGFNAGEANRSTSTSNYHYLNGGIGGATLRIWYYLLKKIDPNANRYKYIVVTLPSYRNSPPFDGGFEARMLDADFLAPLISTNEFIDFIGHQTGDLNKFKLFNRVVIASSNYSSDFLDFIRHPLSRIDGYKWRQKVGLNYGDGYTGNPENMVGLSMDSYGKILSYPIRLNNHQKEQVKKYLISIKNGSKIEMIQAADYKNLWLEKILKRYQNKHTKIIIMRLPSTPLPGYVADGSYPLLNVIKENGNNENVFIIPEETFLDLEAPDNFWDMQHLNGLGRARLTRAISQRLSSLK